MLLYTYMNTCMHNFAYILQYTHALLLYTYMNTCMHIFYSIHMHCYCTHTWIHACIYSTVYTCIVIVHIHEYSMYIFYSIHMHCYCTHTWTHACIYSTVYICIDIRKETIPFLKKFLKINYFPPKMFLNVLEVDFCIDPVCHCRLPCRGVLLQLLCQCVVETSKCVCCCVTDIVK